jgi:hypothetical protein
MSVKSKAILVLWDIENVCGTQEDIVNFIYYFKQGINERFCKDGNPLRFRIQVFHNPAKPHLERRNLTDTTVKDELQKMGVSLVDIGSSRPQQADICIKNRMREIMEDWNPKDCIVVLVSGDKGFIYHMEDFKSKGFEFYLVCNFDCLAASFKKITWLEIWSYFVIAHGDLQKMSGSQIIRRGRHPHGYFKFELYPDSSNSDFVYSSSGKPVKPILKNHTNIPIEPVQVKPVSFSKQDIRGLSPVPEPPKPMEKPNVIPDSWEDTVDSELDYEIDKTVGLCVSTAKCTVSSGKSYKDIVKKNN